MDWKDLAGPITSIGGTVLGTMLGVPGLGQVAGGLLGKALGVDPTPEAVGAAVETSPTSVAVSAVQSAEAEADKARYEFLKAQTQETGLTMRAELGPNGHESLFKSGWRPFHGWELTIQCFGFGVVLAYLLLTTNTESLSALANLSGLLMTYFSGRLLVLGVTSAARTREKEIATGSEVNPSIIGAVIKTITKGRG